MNDQIIVVYITAPTNEVGEKIANELMDQKLAACVNLVSPIQSYYLWEGEKQVDEEVLLIIKTMMSIFESRFVPAIQRVHPYDVPEIIAIPIVNGSKQYLDWIRESISR